MPLIVLPLNLSPKIGAGQMGSYANGVGSECTKIAHRRSLAIFTADEGIAGNSAARTIFTHFLRRRNRGSLAIFFAEEIAHLGARKKSRDFLGSGQNRRRSRRESYDFGALRVRWLNRILTGFSGLSECSLPLSKHMISRDFDQTLTGF